MAKTRGTQARKKSCLAQEQALQVNFIKYSIDKKSNTPLCRFCNEKTEDITRIVSACSILAKSQNRKCYDKVGIYVHWLLCKKHHLQCSDKRYTHTHRHTHTHTHHNQSTKMVYIKSFRISIFKQVKL